MTRVSIKDIAREADVSHSTVSRALADSPLVNATTKARIKQLASEMGYAPDARARSLVMGKTQTIGLVVTTIDDPFVAKVVQAIETTARDHGYNVLLATSSAEPERELAAVEMLQSSRVDGVIVTSSRVGALYQEQFERLAVPVVLLNSHRTDPGPYTFSVNVDNRHGAYLATDHLIQLGHRRIAYVTGAANHSDDLERQAGYRQALREAGIAHDPGLVVPGTGRAGAGQRALEVLHKLPDPPSAVFCYNDMTAIGVLRAARRLGLLVPGDLSVVGFDDIPFAALVNPALTTVSQPKATMGREAMQMALDLMAGEQEPPREVSSIVVQGELVIRESSGAVRGAGQ
jgi:DNA-binding LacI/PurR family transcriptional regulator